MFVVHVDYTGGKLLRKLWRPFELRMCFSVLYTVKVVGYLGQCFQPPGTGINYTGQREVLLEFVNVVF